MSTEEQNNELTDVVLCYQSLGLPLDSSPAQVEKMYRSLADENKRKLTAPEPALREEARKSQELVDEMYDKIRGSITYRAMEKDHEKRASSIAVSQVNAKRPAHRAAVEKRQMVNCPRCNGSIARGLKSCPICKGPLYTPTQKIVRALFSPKKLIIYCLLLVVAASLTFYLTQRGDGAKSSLPEFDSLEPKAPAK
jgi:hypothetical protein